ncbi:MAG: dipicolinic acid synthetase [Lachnospiraceae bacterium]|nr:dipicolinic acid synthetase [Lachnospiraceae bacterium]
MEKKKILVIGGDERQKYLAGALKDKAFEVAYEEQVTPSVSERIKSCQILLLPIAAKEPITDVAAEYAVSGQKIYGGVFPAGFSAACEEKGVLLYDYMKDDTIAIQNAVATAEGAIAEAIVGSKRNLHNSRCLVLGFGRCGEILADKLKGLKCDVTIMVRSEKAMAKAAAYGYHVKAFGQKIESQKEEKKEDYHFIFNTVPAMVADRRFLEKQSRNTLIIDLASAPGGVDRRACEELGITLKSCLGLPAKYAPETSADILAKIISRREWDEERSVGV